MKFLEQIVVTRIESNLTVNSLCISQARLGPLPKKTRLISVILLNGQEVQTQVQVNSKGKELFEQIAQHIGLKESLYFGFALLEGEFSLVIKSKQK